MPGECVAGTPLLPHPDLVGDQLRTSDMEQFDEGVVPSGDGRTGLQGRPEGVHDYRVPSGVGVDTGNSLVYGAEE